jgi:hypothetical protein
MPELQSNKISGTFWKSIGDAMNISYTELPSCGGWKDGLHWYEELEAWNIAYEERYMVPDINNKKTADETTALILYDLPKSWWPAARQVVSALMDKRLRKAMMYAPPPGWLQSIVDGTFYIRKLALRYLMPPRPDFLRVEVVSKEADEDGRYHLIYYTSEPWYVAANLHNRYGFQAWFKWFAGKPFPGAEYKPEGYLIPQVGPRSMEGRGMKEFEVTKDKLMKAERSGCPFA